MAFKPWGLVRVLARIGTPLLRLFGIGDKSAAAKAVEAAKIVEPLLPPDEKSTK